MKKCVSWYIIAWLVFVVAVIACQRVTVVVDSDISSDGEASFLKVQSAEKGKAKQAEQDPEVKKSKK